MKPALFARAGLMKYALPLDPNYRAAANSVRFTQYAGWPELIFIAIGPSFDHSSSVYNYGFIYKM
jgi:hypothetical protein